MSRLWAGVALTAVVLTLATGCESTSQTGSSDRTARAESAGAKKPASPQRWMMAAVGTSSPQEYDELMWMIDPYGQIEEDIRNIAGIKAVYEYHLRRGDIGEANRSAAALVQYTQNAYAKYEGASRSLLRKKNWRAAQTLRQSYAANGGSPFRPRFLLGATTGVRDAQLLWERFTESAAAARPSARRSAPPNPDPLPMLCMGDGEFMLCN
jgi:hypothetical protein